MEDRIERFRKAYEKALSGKWKGGPASITNHLQRRKKHGHLPPDATESDLIQKGMEVLQSECDGEVEFMNLRQHNPNPSAWWWFLEQISVEITS